MSIVSRVGHGRTDINNPDPSAICDICGLRWCHSDLAWQFQWAGNDVVNLRLLACPHCQDTPNEQLRSLVLPPDPVPIDNPRTEPFQQDANPSMVTNWDTPGADYNDGGNNNSWDNVVPD